MQQEGLNRLSCFRKKNFIIFSFFIRYIINNNNMQLEELNHLSCFEKYVSFQFVNENELNKVVDYICGNLNSHFSYYPYWYDLYCCTSKNRIVLRHKKANGEEILTKLGECVCQKVVINFLQNQNKSCLCDNGCASLYFKVIF